MPFCRWENWGQRKQMSRLHLRLAKTDVQLKNSCWEMELIARSSVFQLHRVPTDQVGIVKSILQVGNIHGLLPFGHNPRTWQNRDENSGFLASKTVLLLFCVIFWRENCTWICAKGSVKWRGCRRRHLGAFRFVSKTTVIWGWWDSTSVFPLLKNPLFHPQRKRP